MMDGCPRTGVAVAGDDAPGCVECVWRLDGVTFGEGSHSEYVCVRCGVLLLVPPGGGHPQTV